MLSLSRTSLAARTAALALVGATLVGCASHPNTPAATVTPETLVSERAQQRWDRLLANDYRQAYDFLTPAYRGLKTPEEYAKTFGNGAEWHSAKVLKTECKTQEACTVTISVSVLVMKRKDPVQTTITETWVQEDNSWWLHQK